MAIDQETADEISIEGSERASNTEIGSPMQIETTGTHIPVDVGGRQLQPRRDAMHGKLHRVSFLKVRSDALLSALTRVEPTRR